MEGEIRVGYAERDITPEDPGMPMTGYHSRRLATSTGTREGDGLRASALVLARADEVVALVSFDLLALSRDSVRRIRNRLSDVVEPGALVLNASHTHTAPATVDLLGMGTPRADYVRQIEDAAVDAVREARDHASACHVLVHHAQVDVGRVRRDPGFSMAVPDRNVTIVRVLAPDGKLRAVWFAHGMHPVKLGATREISADWPGAACWIASQALGCPVMYAQGASGDVNPRGDTDPDSDLTFDQIAQAVADAVVAGSTSQGATPVHDLGPSAIGTVGLPTDRPSAPITVEAQIVRLENLALVAINGEVFVGLARAISDAMPFAETRVLGVTNGSVAYLPDQAAFEGRDDRPDYEVNEAAGLVFGTGRLTPEAPERLLQLVEELARQVTAS